MKVLIFSLSYFPHVGGAEIAIKEITDRIRDIEFHLITLRFGAEKDEEKIGNVFVHRIGARSGAGGSYLQKILFAPRAALKALALHRVHRFDLFWAMMSYMLFPIVLLRMRRARVPYVLSLQEGDPFEHVFKRLRIMPVRPLLRYGFKHATAVQAISSFLGAWANKAGFLGQVDIIPNGVDLSQFTQTYTHARSADQLTLVTTSRLVHKNAIDDVIRALVLIPESVRFIIYGTGREEKKLRKLAQELRVADRVEFKGFIDYADIPKALESGSIFVRPSRSEGMGNSFIEAMAAGLPVVATQEGGIADFLFDTARNPDKEPTGWAVDTDSPEQIANAIKDIMTNPEKVDRITSNAKRLVTEWYQWDAVSGQMRGLFQRVGKVGTMGV